jgi:hypothetical protein
MRSLHNRNYCEFLIETFCTYYTRGRRISGFCGGLGRDQETTGGKLRAAGRVRIVGKKIFFFVRERLCGCTGDGIFNFAVAKI